MDIGQGKTNSGETRADCGLWDDGENKEGGSAKLTVYLSLWLPLDGNMSTTSPIFMECYILKKYGFSEAFCVKVKLDRIFKY